MFNMRLISMCRTNITQYVAAVYDKNYEAAVYANNFVGAWNDKMTKHIIYSSSV